MEIHHLGIATDDGSALVELYGGLFDAPVVHTERFRGLDVTFLDLGGSYFELIEPTDEAEGPIPRYLASAGPGIHHVALATADIDAAMAEAEAAGVTVIGDDPRPGAWGHEVAFLHPESTGGVLVEFVDA
jgi:methylmalonyl-CoA/ethylmalonyl-CoA epimerase